LHLSHLVVASHLLRHTASINRGSADSPDQSKLVFSRSIFGPCLPTAIMSFSGLSFIFWRIFQIITLIPALGMLAWFVDWYNSRNLLTPTSILVLFIVSVLGAAWALGTLFLYTRAKHSAKFVAFIDLLFMGAFIGAVYALRGIADADCTNWRRSGSYSTDLGLFTVSGTGFGVDVNRQCAMLKASWAFGIM
jgi:hypothetical protein